MLRLLWIAFAAVVPLAVSGCSASASDPPQKTSSPQTPAPPRSAAPRQADAATPAAAAVGTAPGPEEETPGTPTQPVIGTVPPSLAPVGPIPGPQMAGENPSLTIRNPYSNNPSALEQGRQFFVAMNCAGCHGGHAGGGMGPDLRPDHIWRYGDTPAALFDSISEGRGMGMPAWGTKLPPDVIWKLVAYIQSLGTQDEPDKAAPPPAHAPDSVAGPAY